MAVVGSKIFSALHKYLLIKSVRSATMGILNLLSVFFLTFDQLARGKFITPVCRVGTGNCVRQNSKETWCYAPDPYYTPTTAMTSCTASGADYVTFELQGALQSHLKQNLSIAYYNGVDNNRLGGVDYAVPATSGIVRICLSNSGGTGILQTLCFNVAGDNSVDGFPFCLVNGGPPVVIDGCYPEKFNTNTTTTNTPRYSSTAPNTLITQSILACVAISPLVVAISAVILDASIGVYSTSGVFKLYATMSDFR
jgi:hypothetical protein